MRVAGPRRGLMLLAIIVFATVLGAVRLDDPWRALLIAVGVALAFAEATAVGQRLADGLLWLAAQLLPANARPSYLRMWRADLVESVDGQGPVSFALDVLLSGPVTAVTMRQVGTTGPMGRRASSGRWWIMITLQLILPACCGLALVFVPVSRVPQSSSVAIVLATFTWNVLTEVDPAYRSRRARRRLFVQLMAIAVAVTSVQLPNYSAPAYVGWAIAGLLAMVAVRATFCWSGRWTAVLGVASAIPVSLFGASRWDYFGRDIAELIVCLVVAPMYLMIGRTLSVIACDRFAQGWLKLAGGLCVLLVCVTGASLIMISFAWMCAGSLPFIALGAVLELRRPAGAVESATDDSAVVSVAPVP